MKEVCNAIIKYLVPLYLKVLSTEEEWLSIAVKFETRWQYPNEIGAINGKHGHHMVVRFIIIHKHSHLIILMAIAGPSYECLYADVGRNGRVNDGGVWSKCGFSKVLENQELFIPNPRCLPRGVQRIPFVLIEDDAFALKAHMTKPYP